MKVLFVYVLLLITLLTLSSWGFFAHRQINRLAVFTMPQGTSVFYKEHINYLSEHAVDADKRRYADTAEAPRHYLDVELYEENIDSIPQKWEDAVRKYGVAKLHENGILPWHIQQTYYRLVNAFKRKDSIKILNYSAALGHYIADAHVPLHTTHNHNGQWSNQHGIHAFWESRLPELFSSKYNFIVGKAVYVENPLTAAWKIVKHSHTLVDSVLKLEAKLHSTFPLYQKYSYSKRNQVLQKQYAVGYAEAYHHAMDHMVEKQMRAAIQLTGAFWYSAWIDAGQPILANFIKIKPTAAENRKSRKEREIIQKEKLIGREF